MHEILTGTRALLGHPLNYYLLTDATGSGENTYGLMVQYRGEQACVRDITSRREDMLRLLDDLLLGGVTPTTVRDIVDDWLLI